MGTLSPPSSQYSIRTSGWFSTLLSLHLVKVISVHIAEGDRSKAEIDIRDSILTDHMPQCL